MKIIALTAILFTLSSSAFARKPAVEDFVGVEPSPEFEMTETTTPINVDTTVKFNYGNQVKALDGLTSPSSQTIPTWFSITALLSFMLLPFMMWIGITKKAKTEILKTNDMEFENEALENVASLEDYKKTESSEKKAS